MTSKTDLGLLLLHALPFDSEMWDGQMSLLPSQTYAPNLYDFGGDIKVWAKDALAMASEQNLIVVGCSVGGSCALEIANLVPERVSALVLISTKARHDPDPAYYRNYIKLLQEQGTEAAWLFYWEALFESDRDKEVAQVAQKIAFRQSAKNLMDGLSAFHNRPSREEFIGQCDFPIHVVTGEEDNLPGLDYSRQLVETAQNGTLHVIKSSGHYVPMVKPHELNTILENIIQTHS